MLLTRHDPAYDDERSGYQRLGAHAPDRLIRATSTDDVVAAVRHAADNDLPIAVQSGGHGLTTPLDRGVLISTRALADVQVDPTARTAHVPAGATWQRVIEAAAPHGLAPLSGSSPSVGAVSYTLGGGVGLLARRHGFAADHVRSFEVVTPDGRLRHASPEREPELFWGLRGGGGNLGVVTAMTIDLVPLTQILGGGIYLDLDRTPDALRVWHEWTRTLPDEVTSAVAVLPFPDLPMVPPELRGRHAVQVQVVAPADWDRAFVEPLRALDPIRDTLRVLPYTESATVFDEPDRPHAYRSENALVADLHGLDELPGRDVPVMCVVGIRHLGGALARPPATPSAVGHRDAGYAVTVLSPVEPGQEDVVRATHEQAMKPWRRLGRSLNFSFGPLTPEQVREAYEPADHTRLLALRDSVDPAGLLRPNHPLRPTR